MSDEIRLGAYEDRDKDGYVKIHAYELGQLIKQANGAYSMLTDLNCVTKEQHRLRAEVDNWVKVADDLLLLVEHRERHERWNDIMNNYFIAKGFEQ